MGAKIISLNLITNMKWNWGIKLTKEAVDEGFDLYSFVPWYFGFSHREFDTNMQVYYPIPLNLIVPLIQRAHYHLAVVWPRFLARPFLHIYRLGQTDGLEMGRFNKEVVRGAAEILKAEGLKAHYREEQ